MGRREADSLDETLVPPGQYLVSYVRQERAKCFGRDFWAVTFKIIDRGPHFGLPVPRFYNLPKAGKRARRSSNLFSEYVVACQARPPRMLHRVRPAEFLQGCEFRARIVSVTVDRNGARQPDSLHYSRIDALVERTAGVPPLLRRSRP